MRSAAALVLCLGGGMPAISAPTVKDADPGGAESKRLEGTWRTVKSTSSGKDDPDAVGDLMEIKGDRIALTVLKLADKDGKPVVFESTIRKLDPSTRPKSIDVTRAGTKGDLRNIYDLTGDRLTIAIQTKPSEPPPTEFKSEPGSGIVVVIYERVKPKE